MAENFMSAHSILRQEKIKNKTENENTLNGTIENIIENNGFDLHGNGEVFYNFDKKKFVRSINGMTKFLIALGTLNSRFDNEKNSEKKTILHYVHIPVNIPKEKKKLLDNKNYNVRKIESDVKSEIDNKDNSEMKLNTELTSMKNLIAGDTFLLHSNWIESQQSEILNDVEIKKKNKHNFLSDKNTIEKIKNKNEKLFISGKINNNKNEKFIKISQNDQNLEIKAEYSINDDTNNNNLRVQEDIVGENKNKNLVTGDSSAVCVKYMGSIGGLWPTPQVRSCHTIRTYSLSYFFLMLIVFQLVIQM